MRTYQNAHTNDTKNISARPPTSWGAPERIEPHSTMPRHDAGVRSGGSRRPQRQQRDARDRISAAIETACSGWSGPRLRPLGATTRPWTVDAAALNLAEREPMHTRSVTRG